MKLSQADEIAMVRATMRRAHAAAAASAAAPAWLQNWPTQASDGRHPGDDQELPTTATSQNEQRIISWWPNHRMTQLTRLVPTSLEELEHSLNRPPTLDADKHDLPCWSAGACHGSRSDANVRSVACLGFDADNTTVSLADAVARLPIRALGHTTYSHERNAATHRWRILVWPSRTLAPEEFRPLWDLLAHVFGGLGVRVDPSCKNVSRLWYVATQRPGFQFATNRCDSLDVPAALDLARKLQTPGAPVRKTQPAAPVRPSGLDAVERASRYLAKMPASIAGSGGDQALWNAAQKMVRGFSLSESDALHLLRAEFNPRCLPAWDDAWIVRKVRQASEKSGLAWGYLLDGRSS